MHPVGFQRKLVFFPKDLLSSLAKALVIVWNRQVTEALDWIVPMRSLCVPILGCTLVF